MSLDNIEKVQATTYRDEEHPTEEKPGLFLVSILITWNILYLYSVQSNYVYMYMYM